MTAHLQPEYLKDHPLENIAKQYAASAVFLTLRCYPHFLGGPGQLKSNV